MPRDILSDSLAVLSIVEDEDEECWPLSDKSACKKVHKKVCNLSSSNQESFSKDDGACYYNYGLGESMTGRQQDSVYQYKTSSLPAGATPIQSWDDMICTVLEISPEDIANQLTLLDIPCFKSIKPEELTSCGWNKANKLEVAPNIVAFTKRFNRVSFWTVQEILNSTSPKSRAETLVHFIKVGKKLYELNNLHSLFAIISALQSASIYRLSKTWAMVSKKDKQMFDKMAELFLEQDNWAMLREYLDAIALPCIPYLGIFLTDLVYINIAHPMDSPNRMAKMDIVLKALKKYQCSEYDILPLPTVSRYLNSVRYIEELQKFLEEDHYKLSLKLEPQSPVASSSGSKESVKEIQNQHGISTPFNLSPSHLQGTGSLRLTATNQSKFIPTHRKSRSLGSNIFGKSHTEENMDNRTPPGSVNLLDDTLLESPTSTGEAKGLAVLPKGEILIDPSDLSYQSFIRRKTVLKEGKKSSLSSWQRYWIQICGNCLIYYAPKSFKGTNRNDFRSERCKTLPLEGWTAQREGSDPPDVFQLANRQVASLYKFKTGSDVTAKEWVQKIEEATSKKVVKPLPANLMSFE